MYLAIFFLFFNFIFFAFILIFFSFVDPAVCTPHPDPAFSEQPCSQYNFSVPVPLSERLEQAMYHVSFPQSESVYVVLFTILFKP